MPARTPLDRRALRAATTALLVTAGLTGAAAMSSPARAATGCAATWTVTSQWPGGFTANAAVTALGGSSTNWRIGWTWTAGQVLTGGWNATVTQSGGSVTAVAPSWAPTLAAGGTATIGVQGTSGSTNPAPTGFTLDGIACTGAPAPSTTSTTTTSTTTTNVPTSSTQAPTTSTTRPPTTSTTRPPTTSTTRPPTTSATPTGSHWETLLDSSSFTDYPSFERAWKYRYPWGADHNGTARMYADPSNHNHVSLSGGVLTLRATRINWDEGKSTADPHLPIRYHSGAVHAKQQVVVTDQFPNWEVRGDFQAPSARGTWPAFWLTGVNSWPPESDILEFKGDARTWFNTFRTSRDVSSTAVGVSSPGNWHTYKAWITKVNATDVDIHYYVDGAWKAKHRATNFVGKPMWIIVNLQMEGSSGSPGPTADTSYRARNVYVGRTRAW